MLKSKVTNIQERRRGEGRLNSTIYTS